MRVNHLLEGGACRTAGVVRRTYTRAMYTVPNGFDPSDARLAFRRWVESCASVRECIMGGLLFVYLGRGSAIEALAEVERHLTAFRLEIDPPLRVRFP